jgi:hypothetical protein
MAWKREFMEVDLDRVRMPDIDPDWQYSQHGRSREDYEQWSQNDKEIQRLRDEEGLTADDFIELKDSPDPSKREIGKSYHYLYGSNRSADAKRLDWDEKTGSLIAEGGKHRIWIDKTSGLKYTRAEVSAPDQETLERIRREHSRPDPISRDQQYENTQRIRPVWERSNENRDQRTRERLER